MTSDARSELEVEVARLVTDVEALAWRPPDEESDDSNSEVTYLPVTKAAARLERLRAVLDASELVDVPGRAVIGCMVTLREADGTQTAYTIVAPGEGAPAAGLIAADSPLGRAVLNSGVNDQVEVIAPAGNRVVRVERIGER